AESCFVFPHALQVLTIVASLVLTGFLPYRTGQPLGSISQLPISVGHRYPVNSGEYLDQISRDDVGHINAVDFADFSVDVRQLQVLYALQIPQAGFISDEVGPELHAEDLPHEFVRETAKHLQVVRRSDFNPFSLEGAARDNFAELVHLVRAPNYQLYHPSDLYQKLQ